MLRLNFTINPLIQSPGQVVPHEGTTGLKVLHPELFHTTQWRRRTAFVAGDGFEVCAVTGLVIAKRRIAHTALIEDMFLAQRVIRIRCLVAATDHQTVLCGYVETLPRTRATVLDCVIPREAVLSRTRIALKSGQNEGGKGKAQNYSYEQIHDNYFFPKTKAITTIIPSITNIRK